MTAAGAPLVRCPGCGKEFRRLGKHLHSSKGCAATLRSGPEPTALDSQAHAVVFQSERQALVADGLASLRYDYYMSEANIDRIKCFVSRWQAHGQQHLIARLRQRLPSAVVDDIMPLLDSVFGTFDGLRTQLQEAAVARLRIPKIAPRIRRFSANSAVPADVVDVPVPLTLERLLQQDAYSRKLILQASDAYKTGDMHKVTPDVLHDLLDGSVARHHPHRGPL